MLKRLITWAVSAAFALAVSAAPLPAIAQEGLGFWPGSGGGVTNVSQTEEWIGYNDGTGTSVNAGNGTKTVSSSLGTTVGAWAGFCIFATSVNSSGNRYLLDVMDSNSNVIAANIFLAPGLNTSGVVTKLCIPLNVAAGKSIFVGVQSSGTGNSLKISIQGLVRQANSPPLWNTFTALNPDTGATKAGTINVQNQTTNFASPTWTQLVSSTPTACGALLYNIGENGGPSSGYVMTLQIGVTPSGGSLTEISRAIVQTSGSGALYREPAGLISQSIPSAAAISAAVANQNNTSDTHRVGLYCLS